MCEECLIRVYVGKTKQLSCRHCGGVIYRSVTFCVWRDMDIGQMTGWLYVRVGCRTLSFDRKFGHQTNSQSPTSHGPLHTDDIALQWRHNGLDGVSNHQPHHCLFSRLFGRRSKKTSKRRVTGLCAGNSPGTGEFPAQMASNAENVSIWWRHHGTFPSIRWKLWPLALSLNLLFHSQLKTCVLSYRVLLDIHGMVCYLRSSK